MLPTVNGKIIKFNEIAMALTATNVASDVGAEDNNEFNCKIISRNSVIANFISNKLPPALHDIDNLDNFNFKE